MRAGSLGVVAVALGALLAGAGQASAADLLAKDVTVASAVDRSCTDAKPEGVIRSARQVYVARGQKRSFDLRTDCKVRR